MANKFDNEVTLLVDDVLYKHWKSAQITSELNTIAPAFTVEVVPTNKNYRFKLKPTSLVNIRIGDDLVLTGYIEKTPVSYSFNSSSMSIAGRSKTADLIDCTVMVDDKEIDYSYSTNNNSWSQSKKQTVSCPSKAAIEYKKVELGTVIAQLIMPYGIKLVNEGVDLSKKIDFSVKQEDTVLKALQAITSKYDIIFYGDEEGNIVREDLIKMTIDV